MAADDITTGELARLIRRVEEGQQTMLQQLNQRLDKTVSSELYSVQHKATQEEITEIKNDLGDIRQEIKDADQRRIADRRWWITAIAVPVGLVLVEYVMPLLGGGSV